MNGDGVPTVVIDAHAHIWGRGFLVDAFFRRSAEGWAERVPGRRAGDILPRLIEGVVDETGDAFVETMDAAGVAVAAIMMVDAGEPLFGEEPAVPIEAQIEWYAAIAARHPGRLKPHVQIDHRRSNALALVRRAVVDHGFAGIGEITPDGFAVDEPALRPMMHLAADLGVPVHVHTRSGLWADIRGHDHSFANPAHPAHVSALARAVPGLKLVLAHAGWPHWWAEAADCVADLETCHLDVSNWDEGGIVPEAIVPRLACLRGRVGTDRILFASDQVSGPRFSGQRSRLAPWVAFFRHLPQTAERCGYRFLAEEAAAIVGGNAARLFGIKF